MVGGSIIFSLSLLILCVLMVLIHIIDPFIDRLILSIIAITEYFFSELIFFFKQFFNEKGWIFAFDPPPGSRQNPVTGGWIFPPNYLPPWTPRPGGTLPEPLPTLEPPIEPKPGPKNPVIKPNFSKIIILLFSFIIVVISIYTIFLLYPNVYFISYFMDFSNINIIFNNLY